MKIQATPWSSTSTGIPSAKRRRKRSSSGGGEESSQSDSSTFLVEANFLPPLSRSSKKARAVAGNGAPLIVLTGEHHISVVGQSSSSLELEEIPVYQYQSRPGRSTAFVNDQAVRLAAVTDIRHDRVYAAANQNRQLQSWTAASGPEAAAVVELVSPAVSLAATHGLVHGSCDDGSLYLARVHGDAWIVETLDAEVANAQHLATVAVPVAAEAAMHRGQKKRPRETTLQQSMIVYQVFATSDGVEIVRRVLDLSPVSDKILSTLPKVQRTTVSWLTPFEQIQVMGLVKDEATLVLSLQQKLTLGENGCATTTMAYSWTSLSLERGQLVHRPMPLPEGCSGPVCLVGASLVAAWTRDGIVLADRLRGAVVATLEASSLPDGVDMDAVTLVGDEHRARLALLYTKANKIWVAVAGLETSEKEPLRNRLNLAACLAAARASAVEAMPRSNGEHAIGKALAVLRETVERVRKGEKSALKKNFVQSRYDVALSTLAAPATAQDTAHATEFADNPQDSSKDRKANGYHHSHSPKENKRNGVKLDKLINGVSAQKPVLAPRSLPHSFVGPAFGLFVELLLATDVGLPPVVRNEASLAIRHLVWSRRLSARQWLHPDTLTLTLKALPAASEHSYSAVDFCLDMYRCCEDVSEHLMVFTLGFGLHHTSADDYRAALSRNDPHRTPANTSDEGRSILAGTTTLLKKILAYSDCNESLLRTAIRNQLHRNELSLLCRLVVDAASALANSAESQRRALLWLSVLCGELRGALSENEARDLDVVRRSIRKEASRTESLLPLHDLVDETVTLLRSGRLNKSGSSTRERGGQLPPYQIERLVF